MSLKMYYVTKYLVRGIELDVFRLSWLNHGVLSVLHHHKVLQLGQVLGVLGLLHGLLVVDLSNKLKYTNVINQSIANCFYD